MTPDQLADLSARAYRHMVPWTAAQFAETLALPRSLLAHTEHAFVLGQVIAGEAEILALATDPDHQRGGEATQALARFHDAARMRDATQVFLEVSVENSAAIAFYTRHGYAPTGQRKGYYSTPQGHRADAVIMVRMLP